MAQRSKRSKIDTPTARGSLPISKKPTYKSLEPGVFIGYRRGQLERRWVARIYIEAERKYVVKAIGDADDADAPHRAGRMSYAEARDAVLAEAGKLRRKGSAEAAEPVATIRTAVDEYVRGRDARETARRGRPVKSDAHRLGKHVLGDEKLADLPLEDLTAKKLAAWRAGLQGAAGSRRRTANDFRAALFAATKPNTEVRSAITEGLRIPETEEGEQAPRDNQILADAEVRRLTACARAFDDDGDLYRMVLLLAATGARFSQVRRLRVMDVQESRLMMPASRKGRKRTGERPPVPVPVGADVIAALQPAIRGRQRTEPLLERWRHVQIGPGKWKRDSRGPWTSASELARPFAAIAVAAQLKGVIPYALRHSSIVRGLRQNLPIRLVAALHDTSVAMIERHYAAYIAEGLEELAARAIVPMVEGDHDNVVPFHSGAA